MGIVTYHAVSACQQFFPPWASTVLLKMYIKNNFPLITSAIVFKKHIYFN